MARRSRIIQTEAGNAIVRSGEWHDNGDNDDAGSEISLLMLNNRVIHAEGLFLNLYCPCSGVRLAE